MKNTEKIASYSLILLLFILVMMRGVYPAWTKVYSDFANYYVSAHLVADGVALENIYNNEWFQEKIKFYGIDSPGKFAPFPPVTSFLMLPLTSFQPITAQRIFTMINLAFIGLGIFVLGRLTGWAWRHCALIVLVGGVSLFNNIAFGQVYWIMTVLIFYAFLWKENNRLIPAAIALGFFTCLKYFPIVFMGGYFLVGILRWRKVSIAGNSDLKLSLYSGLVVIIICLFQFIFFKEVVIREFIQSSFLPHLDGELKGQGLFSFPFQSWDVLFRNFFVYDQEFNPNPWLNWPEAKQIAKISVVGIVGGAVTLVLLRARAMPLEKQRSIYLAIPALGALVLLPVSATYHFILLLLPLVLLMQTNFLSRWNIISLFSTYVFVGFIPYGLAVQLSHTWGLWFAFPRLILVTLLFCLAVTGVLSAHKKMVRDGSYTH